MFDKLVKRINYIIIPFLSIFWISYLNGIGIVKVILISVGFTGILGNFIYYIREEKLSIKKSSIRSLKFVLFFIYILMIEKLIRFIYFG